MPIDIGESINEIADLILNAPIVHTIVGNPIYTALVITFIIILLIVVIFRDADTDESLFVMVMRGGFWIFIALLGTIFLHNKVLTMDNTIKKSDSTFDEVFKDVNNKLDDSFVEVKVGQFDE